MTKHWWISKVITDTKHTPKIKSRPLKRYTVVAREELTENEEVHKRPNWFVLLRTDFENMAQKVAALNYHSGIACVALDSNDYHIVYEDDARTGTRCYSLRAYPDIKVLIHFEAIFRGPGDLVNNYIIEELGKMLDAMRSHTPAGKIATTGLAMQYKLWSFEKKQP